LHLDWNTLLSSGIGALIGSALTLIAAYFSHRWAVSKQAEKDAQMLMGVLQAVHDEIETLWDIYMDGIGHQLEALPNGQALNTYDPVTQEYFTVYNTNAFFIGRIRDNDLRKLIVSTYSKARGLIDSYRLNNDFVRKHEHAYWLFQETNNQIHQAAAAGHWQGMIDYAAKLRKAHDEMKKQIQNLLRALRKEGVLSKNPNH
jgi:hypothetical protein